MSAPAGAGNADAARDLVDRAIAAEAAGDADAAIRLYRHAIELDPAYPAPHFNLGLAWIASGDLRAAESEIRCALGLRPAFPEAWVGLAEVLEATGREDEALAALDEAIEQREHYAGALFNSSVLLQKLGRLAEADARLFAFAEAQTNDAVALQAHGRRAEAVEMLFESLAVAPSHPRLRQCLSAALYGVTLNRAGDRERGLLASLCADHEISTIFLATAVVGVLKGDTGFPALLEAARAGRDPLSSAAAEARSFASSPLLLAALPRMTIMDPDLEAVLANLRRAIVMRIGIGLPAQDRAVPFDFACALARQCFFSEYAFFEGEGERRLVAGLRTALDKVSGSSDIRALEWPLAISALYDSLSTAHRDQQCLERPPADWSDAFRPVVQEQYLNRRREQVLALAIPAITPISDAVSVAVRAQYEENPYPLWASVQRPEFDSVEALSRRLRPGRAVRVRSSRARILIAGCGTGHHPVQVARAFSTSEILAVDLSLASLAYASRMAERFGVRNVRFSQGDILGLGVLDEHFAIVESAGVLHHLKDPMQGWKVLTGLMQPDGFMRIALYSESARAGVSAARQFLQPLSLPVTPDGIRRSRRAILGLPEGHAAREVLTFGDFYTLNGCRDLLMHVQEHLFTLPKIAECLDALGLDFLRMECDAQTRERFNAMAPEAGADRDLGAWHRFEQAYSLSFKSMYQFWCAKKE